MNSILSAIIAAILSLFGIHQSTARALHSNPPSVATTYSESAAAAAALNPFTNSPTATSSDNPSTQSATSYDTTNSPFVKPPEPSNPSATNEALTAASQSAVSEIASPVAASPAPNYVTQQQFTASMSVLGNIAAFLPSLLAQQSYSSDATPPLGGGSSNTIALANRINALSDVTISNSTIDNTSIPDLSGTYLSLSGGGTITGGTTFSNATSTNFFATNASTTNATSTTLFSVLGNFTSGIFNSLSAAVATITNLTATGITTTNATTTNATTTNEFDINLTATNSTINSLNVKSTLSSPSATIGALTATTSLAVYNTASFGATATSTFDTNGLLTLPSGFVSQASSTITSGLFSANGGASTTAFTNSGSTWLSGLAASSILALDANNQIVATSSIGVSHLTGVLPLVNGGTATSTGGVTNGVEYFNGTDLTNGSGFVYSGGNVGIGTAGPLSALNVAGTTGITWAAVGNSLGLVTLGTGGTAGGSLWVNTPSLNTSFQSGLGVTGSYTNPGGIGTSIVNINAYGVDSGGGYGSNLAFSTTNGASLNEAMRILGNGNVGIGTASPAALFQVFRKSGKASGTITSSGTAVTGSGTSFLTQVAAGDILQVGTLTATVATITDNTHLTLSAGFSHDVIVAANYSTNPSNNLALFTMTGGTNELTVTANQGLTLQGDNTTAVLDTTNLLTNGNFGTNDFTGWTAGSGWSAAGGNATYTPTNAAILNAASVLITNGGTGYIVGDVLTLPSGSGDAQITVSTVSAGKVTGFTLSNAGTGYNDTMTGTATGGTGTGFTYAIKQVVAGNTLTQTASPAMISGQSYQLTFVKSGGTQGSLTISLGGATLATAQKISNATQTYTFQATSNAALTITPTSDFNGTLNTFVLTHFENTVSPLITFNNAAGTAALELRTSGTTNTFVGLGAGKLNTSATGNSAFGVSALSANTTGGSNSAFGQNALQSNTTGISNNAFGANALLKNTTGTTNEALGNNALQNNTTGSNNIAVGSNALQLNTTGTTNTAVGNNTLQNNTTGLDNSAFGINALNGNTTGIDNIAMGTQSLFVNTTGGSNTAIGFKALQLNTTATGNSAVGSGALQNNITGASNNAVGENALQSNTTGISNNAFGVVALLVNTTGSNNVAVGDNASVRNVSATSTVAVGYHSAFGNNTPYNAQGYTMLGYETGLNIQTGADYNTLLGYGAGNLITTGNKNIVLGEASTLANSNLTTGSNNIIIGNDVQAPLATGSNQLNIGNLIFGTGLTGTGSTIAGNVGIGTTSPSSLLSLGNGAGAAGTTAALGINFGDPTANLYRAGAGTIKTDGGFTVDGLLNVLAPSGNATLTLNSPSGASFAIQNWQVNGTSIGQTLAFTTNNTLFQSFDTDVFRNTATTQTYATLNATGFGLGITSPAAVLDLAGPQNTSAIPAPSTPTIAATLGDGGSCDVGTHTWKVTFLNVAGETTPSLASAIATCTAASSTVPLTIAKGPTGTTARNIYRTVAGNTGSYLLVTTISNNTATTYNDSTGDASLGAAAPSSNTTAIALFQVGGTTRMAINAAGNVGIATTSPFAKLSVQGAGTGTGINFQTTNSSQAPLFSILDNGNATLAGCLNYNGGTSGTCLSDERVKQDIVPFTDGLSEIVALSPVTYQYNGLAGTPNDGDVRTGLIAQQVQQVAPDLVSTTSAYLTASDTAPTQLLEVNYSALTFALINAVKEIASISGTFENALVAWLGNSANGITDLFAKNLYATNITTDQVTTSELCAKKSDGTELCVTGDQLAAVLASQGGAATPPSSDTATTTEATTPPEIQINGNNPAIIQVGATYNDLGATIEGPQADLNLDIQTFLNGTQESPIVIDTSSAATDTIDYVVTDPTGLTSTSTRTVIIQAPISDTVDAGSASTTDATSTSQ